MKKVHLTAAEKQAESIKSIGEALMAYSTAVESFQWLVDNHDLPANADVQFLAYCNSIKYASEKTKEVFATLTNGIGD
jgi:hypothetical protein